MMPTRTHLFWITMFYTFFVLSHGEKKSKRMKENSIPFPKYDMHNNNQLPSDRQISTFLTKGTQKIFLYAPLIKNSPLSITVATCTSIVNWIVKFRENNSSVFHTADSHQVSNLTTQDVQTLHMTTNKGIYIVQITATDADTYAHIYVSTESGGPQALQNLKTQNSLKLLRRQQRKKLTIRWDPSLVDPQVTDYCLVINSQKQYSTLCSALGEKYGVFPPREENQPVAASQTVTVWDNEKKQIEPTVICVGSKTHYTLQNLRQNQRYFFDVFAINKQSNLTYRYGSSFMIFDKRTKPTRLKDNKSTYVNLKKNDGKVVFRYKVGKLLNDSLKIYILPCGGAVDVEVILKGETVAARRRIESFGLLEILSPKIGSRYSIKITSINKEELRRISGVEVLATIKSSSKTPLPNMPSEVALKEYSSLRECNSVTIGWLASSGQRATKHCITVREGNLQDSESFKIPNQCGLENRLKKSADFITKYCRDVKQDKEKVLIQKINQLKSGRSYVVQVTVKKPKGKTLSYDLLQVQTHPSCEYLKS